MHRDFPADNLPREGAATPGAICDAFFRQAGLQPDALAVSAPDRECTYGALALAANHTARELQSRLPPGAVVGLLAKRQPELVVAMLACARAGLTFALLDAAYPENRIELLADLCGASLIIDAANTGRARIAGIPVFAPDFWARRNDVAPATVTPAPPANPAYLLFTSGTTGRPKCVAAAHSPLMHFISWQVGQFSLTAADRFTLLSGLSHDPVLRDVFTPLSIGASIHVPSQDRILQPGGLYAWMSEVRPTVAHMTPPMGQLLISAPKALPLDSLQRIFWGGDILRPSLVNAVAALAPQVKQTNFFGTTETPQAASFFQIDPAAELETIPIGTGVRGFDLVVIGDDGAELSPDKAGEIEVRSEFLSLGYFERGVILPYAGDRARYRTGDIGYRRPDGSIVIVGRRDDQVKVRGFRVDLSEVTAALLQIDGVASCISLNVGDADVAKICAFVTLSGADADRHDRDFHAPLRAFLPSHAIPADFVVVSALPLLPNGKIDRQQLLGTYQARLDPGAASPDDALGATEQRLLDAFKTQLGSKTVTLDSSFESLGGDSLSYVTAYLALEDILGEVPVQWTDMSVRELGRSIQSKGRSGEKSKGKGLLVSTESAMPIRALSISLVVANHLGLTTCGATSLLMFVSGLMFGNMQLKELIKSNSISPLIRVAKRILIPYFILLSPMIANTIAHGTPAWAAIFLISDITDDKILIHKSSIYWYFHCLLHILLIYGLIFIIAKRFCPARKAAIWSLLACIGLGLVGRDVAPLVMEPGFFSLDGLGSSPFYLSPMSHIATFAIAALSTKVNGARKFALAVAFICYAIAGINGYGRITTTLFIAGGLWIMFAPNMYWPRLAAPALYNMAGASMFIYLLHNYVINVSQNLAKAHVWAPPKAVVWAAAMAAGVAAWRLWNLAERNLPRILSRIGEWRHLRGGLGLAAASKSRSAPQAHF